MCKADPLPSGRRSLVLLSTNDFQQRLPSKKQMVWTGVVVIAGLLAIEFSLRALFESIKDSHPVLEDATNRHILARHIGVDSFSCFVVTVWGYQSSHIIKDLYETAFFGKKAMPLAGYEQRMFTYHPEACRMVLFFLAYQIKNTVDTLMWNDGIEFIIHHVLCLVTAWGALIPGSAHFYVPFYFGVSELSTAVLCLLANFDDIHGAKGLATAWPNGKVFFGLLFAVFFVICRVVLWSTVSYYYCRDCWQALSGKDPRMPPRKTWLRWTFVSLSALSVLQVLWLGQIYFTAKEELGKMGFL